jgi:hypothetical protein
MIRKLLNIKKKDLYYEYLYMDGYNLDFSKEFWCRDCQFNTDVYLRMLDHVTKDCRILPDYTLVQEVLKPNVLKYI